MNNIGELISETGKLKILNEGARTERQRRRAKIEAGESAHHPALSKRKTGTVQY